MKRRGLKNEKAILRVRYERNTLAVENAVANLVLAQHRPRAIVMVGAYAPCAKFILLCREAGLRALFLNVSFVGSVPLGKELGRTDALVVVTQIVPSPLDLSLPIVRECVADLRALDATATLTSGILEGYYCREHFHPGPGDNRRRPDAREHRGRARRVGRIRRRRRRADRTRAGGTSGQPSRLATMLQNGAFVPFQWKDLAGLLKEDRKP